MATQQHSTVLLDVLALPGPWTGYAPPRPRRRACCSVYLDTRWRAPRGGLPALLSRPVQGDPAHAATDHPGGLRGGRGPRRALRGRRRGSRARGASDFRGRAAGLLLRRRAARSRRSTGCAGAAADSSPCKSCSTTTSAWPCCCSTRSGPGCSPSTWGRLRASRPLRTDVPAKHAGGGWFALAQKRAARHREDLVLRHVKRVVAALMATLRNQSFDRLFVAGPMRRWRCCGAICRDRCARAWRAPFGWSLFASDAQCCGRR